MEYTVEGKITVTISVSVHADTAEYALGLAKNAINDRYNLELGGSYHKPGRDVHFDLEVFNETDYE